MNLLPPRRPNPGASPPRVCHSSGCADLPLFYGASRRKLLACPATQMQPGSGILSALITNRQAVDDKARTGALDVEPVCSLQT
jgi:hypothetical protein